MGKGIGLALVATLLFSLGNILEKQAVDTMEMFSIRRIGSSLKQIRKSYRWLLGALASVLGALIQIFAYHYISISIVQAMTIAGVVLVVVTSRVHFHESFNGNESIGLVICVVAFLMTIISIDGGGTVPGKQATDISIIIVIVATAAVVVLLVSSRHLRETRRDVVYGASSGLMYGLVGLSSKGLSTLFGHNSRAYELLSVWSTPYLYLMIAAWLLALVLFQHGLQQGRVGVVGPLSGAVTAIYIIGVGTPVFGENFPHNLVALILRVAGLVGILLGSLLLTWTDSRKETLRI